MPEPIAVKSDRPTVLMADAATHHGEFKIVPPANGAKRFHVSRWTREDERFTWVVDSPGAAEYDVTLLVAGKDAEVALGTEGSSPGRAALTVEVNGPWDRVSLGRLPLRKGRNTITLTAPKPGTNLELYSVELIDPELKERLEQEAVRLRSDTSWMRKAGYGVQFHWTSMSQPRSGKRLPYADAVKNFDVRRFAEIVRETGAEYVILTTSHAEYFFPAPIKAIDRIMPGRTTPHRDLIGELIEALAAVGARLILYYHVGHDHAREPGGWWERCGFDANQPETFLRNWESIVGEVGERYGEGLAGWFFDDGCVYYPLNPDFKRMTQIAKAGNTGRVICYNPWIWPRFTDFQDYFCGEGYHWLHVTDGLPADGSGVFQSGPQKGLQAHCNFILERDWGHFVADAPIPPPAVDLDTFLSDMRNAVERGIVPSVNMEIYQDVGVSDASLDYMRALKMSVERARE